MKNYLEAPQDITGLLMEAHTLNIGPVAVDAGGRSTWTVHLVGELMQDGEMVDGERDIAFATNREGEGLWMDEHQVLGTAQFTATSRRAVVKVTLAQLLHSVQA